MVKGDWDPTAYSFTYVCKVLPLLILPLWPIIFHILSKCFDPHVHYPLGGRLLPMPVCLRLALGPKSTPHNVSTHLLQDNSPPLRLGLVESK